MPIDAKLDEIETDETSEEATQEVVDGETSDPDASNADPDSDPEDDGDIEALRKSLKKANAEAARYRTELRTAQTALSAAKSQEEFEKATTDLGETIAKLERKLIIEKHKLPEALAKRLQGSTLEELDADATELAELIIREEVDPDEVDGGLSPKGHRERELTQAELVAKYGRKRVSL